MTDAITVEERVKDALREHCWVDISDGFIDTIAGILNDCGLLAPDWLPTNTKFKAGDYVWKVGEYEGPGKVLFPFLTSTKKLRYMVAHQIEGGSGDLLHVYSESQLHEWENPNAR